MGKPVGGTCYIKVDGVQLTTTGDVTSSAGDFTRTTVVPGFFTEVDRVPFISATFVNDPDFPLERILKNHNLTVTAEYKNGKTETLRDAYVVDETEKNHSESTVSLRFEGKKAGKW